MTIHRILSSEQLVELMQTLQLRFDTNKKRHAEMDWLDIRAKLEAQPEKLWSLYEMERTGGEPDVVGRVAQTGQYVFFDCSAETPKGRRSICFDREGLDSRKEFKPENTAMDMAAEMGIEMLSEAEYRSLQELGTFDTKTSSWIKTPEPIRKLGGAIFAEYRYGHIFVYHNGASSYYAVRGFRGVLKV